MINPLNTERKHTMPEWRWTEWIRRFDPGNIILEAISFSTPYNPYKNNPNFSYRKEKDKFQSTKRLLGANQDDSILAFDSNNSTTVIDCFSGVFDLKYSAVRRECRHRQVISGSYATHICLSSSLNLLQLQFWAIELCIHPIIQRVLFRLKKQYRVEKKDPRILSNYS